MAKAPPAAYHKMLCYVLQEVRYCRGRHGAGDAVLFVGVETC